MTVKIFKCFDSITEINTVQNAAPVYTTDSCQIQKQHCRTDQTWPTIHSTTVICMTRMETGSLWWKDMEKNKLFHRNATQGDSWMESFLVQEMDQNCFIHAVCLKQKQWFWAFSVSLKDRYVIRKIKFWFQFDSNRIVQVRACEPDSSSWFEHKWLHCHKSEVVEPRQALVTDAAEFVPVKWWEAILCGWTVHRLRSKISCHEEICHLEGEQPRRKLKSEHW